MNEMHPTRWTLTLFLVFFAVMCLRPNDVEPSEWEPVVVLMFSMLGLALALFDAAVGKFATAISKRQKRMRYVSALILLVTALATFVGRLVLDVPGRSLVPSRPDIPRATGGGEALGPDAAVR